MLSLIKFPLEPVVATCTVNSIVHVDAVADFFFQNGVSSQHDPRFYQADRLLNYLRSHEKHASLFTSMKRMCGVRKNTAARLWPFFSFSCK